MYRQIMAFTERATLSGWPFPFPNTEVPVDEQDDDFPLLVDKNYETESLTYMVQARWGTLRVGEMLRDSAGLDWLVAGVTTEQGSVRSYLLAAGACWNGVSSTELEGNSITVANDLHLCARLVVTRVRRDGGQNIRQVTLHLPDGQPVAYA